MRRRLLLLCLATALSLPGCGFALQVDDAPAAGPATTVPGAAPVGVVVPGAPTTTAAPTVPGQPPTTVWQRPLPQLPEAPDAGGPRWCSAGLAIPQIGSRLGEARTFADIKNVIIDIVARLDAVALYGEGPAREGASQLTPLIDGVLEQFEADLTFEEGLDILNSYMLRYEKPIEQMNNHIAEACTGYEFNPNVETLNG